MSVIETATGTTLPIRVHGVALRHHRLAAGMRQDELAALGGISKSHLCHLEAGRRHALAGLAFRRIADGIGVDPRLLTVDPYEITSMDDAA